MISDTQNTRTPKNQKKTYTVEEIAEQLGVSKKVAYSLVKSGQAFPPSGDWSTTTEAVRLSMRSTAGFGYFGSLDRTYDG